MAALDNNIEQAKQSYTKIQAEERELVQKLNEKYGPGQLDPETGVFTPSK